MIARIAYFVILGQPVVVWLGILTLVCLLITAGIAVLSKRGKIRVSFKWHPRFAVITIILAIIHALLIILSNYL